MPGDDAVLFAQRLLALLEATRYSATYKLATLLALIDVALRILSPAFAPARTAHSSRRRAGAALQYVPVMRVAYNKLVRDRIPELIESGGRRPVTHVLDEAGYRAALLAKLVEEAQEASRAPAGELAAELADLLEVLMALATTVGVTWEQLTALAHAKRTERGGFDRRLFLEYVEQA